MKNIKEILLPNVAEIRKSQHFDFTNCNTPPLALSTPMDIIAFGVAETMRDKFPTHDILYRGYTFDGRLMFDIVRRFDIRDRS